MYQQKKVKEIDRLIQVFSVAFRQSINQSAGKMV